VPENAVGPDELGKHRLHPLPLSTLVYIILRDAGQFDDEARKLAVRIDDAGEAAKLLGAAKFDRANLDDFVVRRLKPGRLEVDGNDDFVCRRFGCQVL